MKKELWIAACLSAVLGTGVLMLAGGSEAEGLPWEPLNGKIEAALAIQEGTAEQPAVSGNAAPKSDRADADRPEAAAESAKPQRVSVPVAPVEPSPAKPVESNSESPAPSAPNEAIDPNKVALPAGAGTEPAVAAAAVPVDDGKVHLNSADAAALMELSGIGEKKAQAILDYRAQNGPFRDVTDIVKVKGIGAKMLEKMLPDLAL